MESRVTTWLPLKPPNGKPPAMLGTSHHIQPKTILSLSSRISVMSLRPDSRPIADSLLSRWTRTRMLPWPSANLAATMSTVVH
ncbi:hypothetical protein EMPG_15673 [Blastomyces silverae]|uniref:Uncharacterized protein n=1 Tax=Blastomyces silverae TaxID=2060906 RepID=A0A0H1BCR8_9EURO|nr:hypothetical protein EMPG_15673 [Blastomyces silverae]